MEDKIFASGLSLSAVKKQAILRARNLSTRDGSRLSESRMLNLKSS